MENEKKYHHSYKTIGKELLDWGYNSDKELEILVKDLDDNKRVICVLSAILNKLSSFKSVTAEFKHIRGERYDIAFEKSLVKTIESLEKRHGKMSCGLKKIIIDRTRYLSYNNRDEYVDGSYVSIYLPRLKGPTKRNKHYSEWEKYCNKYDIRMIEDK